MLTELVLELLSIFWSVLLLVLVGQFFSSLVRCHKTRSAQYFFTLLAYAIVTVSLLKKIMFFLISRIVGLDFMFLSQTDALFILGNNFVIFYMVAIWLPEYLERRKHAARYFRLQALTLEEDHSPHQDS
jgi:ABC-type tungstate transport system substrate-binding protein